MNVFGKKGI